MGVRLRSVKARNGSKQGPVGERLATLLEVFSPWDGISLTYREFAAELGAPVTGAAVKKWAQRKKFPADIARLIAARARERGLTGVTLEWVLWGTEPGPKKASKQTLSGSNAEGNLAEAPVLAFPMASLEPYGQFAARIAKALQADLSHNDFGQWSSVEVQRTVIWALKDLARRLWVLRFSMSETFKLTDTWAGKIGLPVRPPGRSPEEAGAPAP